MGGVGALPMHDTNQTPGTKVTNCGTIKPTGALTSNRNVTLPTQLDTTARIHCINNACTGSFSVVVKCTSGTTVTVGNGKSALVLVDSRGVTRLTADVTF